MMMVDDDGGGGGDDDDDDDDGDDDDDDDDDMMMMERFIFNSLIRRVDFGHLVINLFKFDMDMAFKDYQSAINIKI